MSDSPPDDVVADWDAELEARPTVQKVHDVILQADEPRRVAAIAEQAGVAPDTARKYLEYLVDAGIAVQHDDNPATYTRNDGYLEWRGVDRLRKEYTIDELETRLEDLSEEIAAFQQTYDAMQPGEVSPQEHGYEALDETMADLRRWAAAREEADRIVDALGRDHGLGATDTSFSDTISGIRQLNETLQQLSALSMANTTFTHGVDSSLSCFTNTTPFLFHSLSESKNETPGQQTRLD